MTFDIEKLFAKGIYRGEGNSMPTVLRIGPYRFHFYTDEGNEPPHIHVRNSDGECKFWLAPSIMLAGNRGIRPYDLREIERLIIENYTTLRQAYHDRHNR